MSKSPLEKVLISLTEIKASMHDDANTSATEMLDETIAFIQQCIENGCDDRKSYDETIMLIGKFLDKLPSIAALIKYLFGQRNEPDFYNYYELVNLGQTIKLCRKARGLTQGQLADLSGISVSHICLMENDKREPTLSKLESISKALTVPLSVLVFLAGQYDEVKELSEPQIEELSNNIMGLMDVAYRQENLF